MTAAAFQATYSDWKVVKGRKVVQVVFELPLETADAAYQALGGMPVPANEVWCGIARLADASAPEILSVSSSGERELASDPGLGPERKRRKFDELPPPQQAGILCGQIAFQKFLWEKFPRQFRATAAVGQTALENAAAAVRLLCNVDSRADIKPDNTEWLSLKLAYQLWQREAEVVPA